MNILYAIVGIFLFLCVVSLIANTQWWQNRVEKRFKAQNVQQDTNYDPAALHVIDNSESAVYGPSEQLTYDGNVDEQVLAVLRQTLVGERVIITKEGIGLDHRKNKNGVVVDVKLAGEPGDPSREVLYVVSPTYWKKTVTLTHSDFQWEDPEAYED